MPTNVLRFSCLFCLTLLLLSGCTRTDPMVQIRKDAEQGDAKAQFLLGAAYFFGHPEGQESSGLFRNPPGQIYTDQLGERHFFGKGVVQDKAEAVKWWLKAAEQGNDQAQCMLGLCYQDGEGVPQDTEEAVVWLQKAKEQGNEMATHKLKEIEKE